MLALARNECACVSKLQRRDGPYQRENHIAEDSKRTISGRVRQKRPRLEARTEPIRCLSWRTGALMSEVRLAEAGKSLVHARRIENRQIERDGLPDPSPQMRMIAKIIERERVNQDAQS